MQKTDRCTDTNNDIFTWNQTFRFPVNDAKDKNLLIIFKRKENFFLKKSSTRTLDFTVFPPGETNKITLVFGKVRNYKAQFFGCKLHNFCSGFQPGNGADIASKVRCYFKKKSYFKVVLNGIISFSHNPDLRFGCVLSDGEMRCLEKRKVIVRECIEGMFNCHIGSEVCHRQDYNIA